MPVTTTIHLYIKNVVCVKRVFKTSVVGNQTSRKEWDERKHFSISQTCLIHSTSTKLLHSSFMRGNLNFHRIPSLQEKEMYNWRRESQKQEICLSFPLSANNTLNILIPSFLDFLPPLMTHEVTKLWLSLWARGQWKKEKNDERERKATKGMERKKSTFKFTNLRKRWRGFRA